MALDKEAVGASFDLAKMILARDLTFDAIARSVPLIRPGMREGEARQAVRGVLEAMGMERVWHQLIVRFGAATLKTFDERSSPDTVLGENDVFFIDLGVVWDGHEGDCGDTFAVGDDAQMHACAKAARTVWHEVAQYWREQKVSGVELYRFAAGRAQALGWALNLAIQGHRVSEFPHKIYQGGDLGALERTPASGLWILEIQLRHPLRDFGAFYEDLLLA